MTIIINTLFIFLILYLLDLNKEVKYLGKLFDGKK